MVLIIRVSKSKSVGGGEEGREGEILTILISLSHSQWNLETWSSQHQPKMADKDKQNGENKVN